MKQRAVLPVLLLCCAGVFVDAFLPCPIIRRQQKISPYTITEATVESSSDTTASSPSNDEATGGYVPSGLTSQEYQAIRAKEQRQQQQQQGTNLGAWGPRFDRGEAPLGDWMVDSNLWINGFVDGGVDDGKNQQVVAPPRVRSVALVAPPGKKGSLVSVQEAQDWLDYHAEWFGLVEEDEDEDDNEEDGNKDDDNQERNVKVAVVDLTGRTWDAEALAVLQPGLVNIASEVEILHLGNTSCTTSESNAASVMKVWSEVFASSPCSLKEIDLSDNDLFQPQVAEYVGKLLSNSPLLERLYMVNCNLEKDVDGSNNHVSPIWTGILSASKNCRLHELILDANPLAGARMAQDVAQVLERCPHLHVFSYCGNQPNANGTRGLADALHTMVQQQTCAQNHPLAILRLENCAFNNEGSVDSLANALANAPNLQRLSLRDSTDKDTTIGLTATHKLLQGLVQANCPLECLDLVGCNLKLESAVDLVQQLFSQTAPYLRSLKADLHELVEICNDQYGEGGVQVLLKPFQDGGQSSVLQDLELDHVSEQCIKDLVHGRLAGLCRLSLFGNAEVQHLDLSDRVDWKRRLSIKYPAAEVSLEGARQ